MKKRVFRTLALVLVMALIGTTAAFAATVPSDVEGQMYEEAITLLIEKGIITGDTDGNFHPNDYLTRAQACIIVVKSMNPPVMEINGTATQPAPKSDFKDMSGYGWAESYIGYAVKKGVTNGYPDGSFKPGQQVTMNELVTMVLRAAGYTDKDLGGTWPVNYTGKAADLELYALIPAPLPDRATKWMAAQFTYNALDKIEAANPEAEAPAQGTDKDKAPQIPDASKMTYTSSSFNDAMTTFAGRDIAKDVTIYTYGVTKDFSSSMEFSKKIGDYRVDTLYKYKNVKTPAFYQLEGDKIVAMVVPMDAGFSGRAYGVINGTIKTLNGNGDAVTGLQSLTATKEITWLGKKGLSAPASSEYLGGEIYEMNSSGGEIQSIYKADQAHRAKVFDEISTSGAVFVEVDSYDDYVVRIVDEDGGALFAVKENASVYVIEAGETEYKVGRLSNIRPGVEIRAYDISDDKELSADIIVISK